MNLDVNMRSETVQIPENQQSLASAFLDVETTEMKKHQVLAQFLHNTRVDDKKKATLTNESNSKEIFESAKVHVLHLYNSTGVSTTRPSCSRSFWLGQFWSFKA